MAASELQVVSAMEETSLIIGTYMIGPIGSGITICLLFALIRFAIRNPQNNNTTQYLLGIFSMLFTVLLNVSYCILGTDLIVPWNDNILLQDDYDSNTMLEFTSLCIFLWYFGKLLFYISFIYYAYSFIALPPKLKLNLKYFMVIQIILTLFSVACLIYLNHNIYQIAITPRHNIQLITQLKGYFFYKNHSNSLTEIASLMPILSDISCLMVLFKIYIQQSHELQFERDRKRQTTKKFIDLCVRSIMLLFCGSLPTWILFINIFIKSSIIWILLPYDLLINNFVLFLMYSENLYLYKLFCVNCHKTLYYQCFFAHKQARKDPLTPHIVNIESKSMSDNIINQEMDGLELKTDDEQLHIIHNHLHILPHAPPNSVDNSYEKKQFLSVRAEEKQNSSDFEGSANEMELNEMEVSASNIIKQIVIGSDKKHKKHKKYKHDSNQFMDDMESDIVVNPEHFRKYDRFKMKRDIDEEIEATLNPFISKSNEASQTSIEITDNHKMEPFLCTPSTFSHSHSHSNNNNKLYASASISGMVVSNEDTFNSDNGRKRKYAHRRNTIDIVSHISDEINRNQNNVSVPSFGHDVHFSFFE